jgi:DNA-binding LytR/AlgR family response regulator
MNLKCIIIDDEPLARKGLREYINDIDFLKLVGEYENPMKAMAEMSELNADLIFLDIQMPKLTGLDFIKTLSDPPLIIFTTAFPEYAVEGFEYNAVDYLLKPFSFERFLKGVLKAKAIRENKTVSSSIASPSGLDYFFIKADNKLVKIHYDDILFVEALQNYVSIQTPNKRYISYLTFKSMEDHLPSTHFVKIHKSYIVNLSHIESIEGNEVKIGQNRLPISRSTKEEVMEKLLNGRFLKR